MSDKKEEGSRGEAVNSSLVRPNSLSSASTRRLTESARENVWLTCLSNFWTTSDFLVSRVIGVRLQT